MRDREYEREEREDMTEGTGEREGARRVIGGARKRARNDFNICSHTLYV